MRKIISSPGSYIQGENDTMNNMPFNVMPENIVAAMKLADKLALELDINRRAYYGN